jgi:adenylate cyclase
VPTYTASQLAQTVGWPEETTRRFFRALGFPDAGEEVRYTEADLGMLDTVSRAVVESDLDIAGAVRLARAIGQNIARLSDWQVAAIASRADQLAAGDDLDARRRTAQQIGADVSDAYEAVLVHSWRRHLGAALTRLDVDTDVAEHEQARVVTAGFADLVNFSALSSELDTNRLGELVEIFESRCGDVVASQEGRMIKTLGDSVLFVHDDAQRALDIAYGLVDVIGQDSRLPDVHIGLATGPVVTRLGDVFGPPVNLAARLTALARRNRVIADQATVDRLAPMSYEARRMTARPLRGFGLVEPVAVRPVRQRSLVTERRTKVPDM